MKKKIFSALAAMLILPAMLSAQADYKKVITQLDHGGLSLTYTDYSAVVQSIRNIVITAFSPVAKSEPEIMLIGKLADDVLAELGVYDIRGYGASVKEARPGVYSCKQVVSWQPSSPDSIVHAMYRQNVAPIMALAPEKTSFAMALAIDGADLQKRFDRVFRKYANEDAKSMYAVVLAQAQMQGIDLPAAVNALTGIGIFTEYDPMRQVFPGISSVSLVFGMKDPAFFKALTAVARNQMGAEVVQNGRIVLPTPLGVTLTVYQHGEYLIATTDAAGMDARLAKKAKSLKDHPDFKAASAAFPKKYVSAVYIAPDVGRTNLPTLASMIPADVKQNIDIPGIIRVIGADKATFAVTSVDKMFNTGITQVETGSMLLALYCGSPLMQSQVGLLFSAVVQSAFTIPEILYGSFGDNDAENEYEPESGSVNTDGKKLRFIRLKYSGGDWDQDMGKGADYNMLLKMKEFAGFNIASDTEFIEADELEYRFRNPKKKPPFIYITGRGNINLTDKEVKQLRTYLLKDGGMLFVDNGGGHFDRSFRNVIRRILPDHDLVDIANDDVIYREPYNFSDGAPRLFHHSGDRALGVKNNGRWIVFYHQGDINDAWKTGGSGLPKDQQLQAFHLGANVITYAMNAHFISF